MNSDRDSPVPCVQNRSGSPTVPPTPLLWFEFLLKPGLLEDHLRTENPEPSATLLLEQFVDQSIKEANNEDSPSQMRKIRSLKVLALKVAAHLNWDFSYLQHNLPLYMVHKVLKDFVEWVSPPELNIQPTTDVCSLDDSVLVALTIYNRWSVRTFVERAVPSKLIKTSVGAIPGAFNVAGVNDMVMKTVKDTLPDSLNFLERCLPLSRDIHFPTIDTFVDADAVPPDPKTPVTNDLGPAPNGSSKVRKEEFLWQLNFDLGCYYFHQQQYGKAAEMFQRVQDLLPIVGSSFYCTPDVPKLQGYLAACSAIIGRTVGKVDTEGEQRTLLSQLEEACASQNFKDVVPILLEDNARQELSLWYRECLGDKLALSAVADAQTKLQVSLCNLVRWASEGRPSIHQLQAALIHGSASTFQFFAQSPYFSQCIEKILSTEKEDQKRNIKSLLRMLCSQPDLGRQLMDCCPAELFSAADMEAMRASQRTDDHQMTRMDTALASQTDNLPLQMGQLELQLLLTEDPVELEAVLKSLHRIAPNRRFLSVCSKWQVDRTYGFIIEGMGNRLMQDYLFILLVKAHHCIEKKNYDAARDHLEAACKATRETSFRLYTGLRNELLYVQLLRLAEQKGAMHAGSDLTQKVQVCLLGNRSDRDIPTREPVLEQCILFLLNSQCWLCFFNGELPMPFWRIGSLVAFCMRDDPADTNKCRTVAKELWNAVTLIFSTTNQTKRSVTGAAANTVTREANLAIMTRVEFVNFVKALYNPKCLSLLLSCLVKLYNILKDDMPNSITHEYPALWPNTITNKSSIDVTAVTATTMEVIGHTLAVDPKNPSWLCTQADACYAKKQYGAALKFYLQAAMVSSNFFESPVPKGVWSEQVYRRCIKSCSQLQCHTQAAILCQFLQPVDYVTAFQALQEKRCYDGSDALYDCFWDLAILEFLIYTHHKRSEVDKKQAAMQVLSQPELNTCNSENLLATAACKRQQKFLQAMAKQYL
ncbi:integrator complex subunit 8-like [Diadema antillarum]|uniref:integrator complex subunit 8-like n=1 Tax=Diadema antillarum TaxID=105358 RepID=UPI003A86849B